MGKSDYPLVGDDKHIANKQDKGTKTPKAGGYKTNVPKDLQNQLKDYGKPKQPKKSGFWSQFSFTKKR